MIQEPPELVAMRLSLGQQLTALREAAGMVQQQIARRTDYSRSSVAKAEAGSQLLTPEFWQTADQLLNADGALLASYEQVHKAKQQHEAQSREAELARAYAEAQARAQALRDTAVPAEAHNGNGVGLPTGQEVLSGLVASVGAEVAGNLTGPLLFLALLSTPTAQAVLSSGERSYGNSFGYFSVNGPIRWNVANTSGYWDGWPPRWLPPRY